MKPHRGSLLNYPNELIPMIGTPHPTVVEIGCNNPFYFIQVFPEIHLYCFNPESRLEPWQEQNLNQGLEGDGFYKRVESETITLDRFYYENLTGTIDLIWLDIPEAERIIEGGTTALSNTRFLYAKVHDWKKVLGPDWVSKGIYNGRTRLLANRRL